MQRPLLINASLLVLALLLASQVWLSPEQDRDRSIPLTSLTPEQVSLIVLENSSGPAIRLERKPGGWMMTQPTMAKASDAAVNGLLEITQTKSIRRFQAPEKLAEFGLAPPQAVLTLNQTRIEMGAPHPMNPRRYMRIGNLIHLINDRFPHLLQAPSAYYIQTKSP